MKKKDNVRSSAATSTEVVKDDGSAGPYEYLCGLCLVKIRTDTPLISL